MLPRLIQARCPGVETSMEASLDILDRPAERVRDGGKPAVAAAAGIDFHGSMTLADPSAVLRRDHHAALIRAVAGHGDRTAFAELFDHFAPRVKSYLIRLGTDDGLAEELVQEVMIMIWRKAASFDPAQASVSTWVFTIARNKRIDSLRRDRRGELDSEDPALHPEAESSADSRVEAREDSERIRTALDQLPPEQAALIRMAYFEDKAHGAIALESELPLGTVKSRLRLALGRLRKALKEDHIE